jgi:hypothetical protein
VVGKRSRQGYGGGQKIQESRRKGDNKQSRKKSKRK